MRYEDFDLKITTDGGGFKVLASSLLGCEQHRLEIPPLLPIASGERCNNSTGPTRDVGSPSLDSGGAFATETLGGLLFDALFSGPVRNLFDRSRGSLPASTNQGLRIRLHLDLREEHLRPLSDLPWELLYCPDTREFLNLNCRTPVVRSLALPRPVRTVPLQLPLRALIAMANPPNSVRLNLAAERKRIESAFRDLDTVELDVLEHATHKSLRLQLREKPYHIVHVMSHGTFRERPGAGALLLESEQGPPDPLTGDIFASFFKNGTTPMLVVLNACESAKSVGIGTTDPFAGVATALLLEGLPAVLAMRTVVRDRSALEFSEELYRRMAAGDPIEAALAEARLALFALSPKATDWSIPTLFVQPPAADQPQPACSAEMSASCCDGEAQSPAKMQVAPPPPAIPTFQQSFQVGQIDNFTNVQTKVAHISSRQSRRPDR